MHPGIICVSLHQIKKNIMNYNSPDRIQNNKCYVKWAKLKSFKECVHPVLFFVHYHVYLFFTLCFRSKILCFNPIFLRLKIRKYSKICRSKIFQQQNSFLNRKFLAESDTHLNDINFFSLLWLSFGRLLLRLQIYQLC